MRALFLFLLLANLAFLAWAMFLAPKEGGGERQPLRAQIEPDRIRVLPPEPGSLAPAPAPKPKPAPPAEAAAAASANAPCTEWGSFTLADLPAAEKALEPLGLGARLTQRRVEETATWWVYMAPQGSRPAAQKKAAELKTLGIEDWFIVADEGKWRWAISLGVFRNEEGAKNQLEALKAKGVRTALMGERELQVPKAWLQVRNADPGHVARWRDIAQSAFPAAEFRSCPP
jgi:hypothetical protein